MNSRLWVLLSVLIGCTSLPLYAQTSVDSTEAGVKKGTWAMQFQVIRDATIQAFDGASIAGKYHVTDQSALRMSIVVARTDSTEDGESLDERLAPIDPRFDNFRRSAGRNGGDRWFLDVALVYLKYIKPATSIRMYLGAGPGFSMDLSRSSGTGSIVNFNRQDNATLVLINRDSEEMWGSGLHFIIGAEWFVLPRISLLAEYNTEAFYSVHTTVMESRVNRADPVGVSISSLEEKERLFTISGQPVRFGLSVYF